MLSDPKSIRGNPSKSLNQTLKLKEFLQNRASILKEIEMENAAIRRKRRTLFNIFQQEEAANGTPPERAQGRPMRVSLMILLAMGEKLLEDESSTAGGGMGAAAVNEEEAVPAEENMLCSVCMVRRKGAAFIPCGHTFCRFCSRVLVTGRRSCPACNKGILDVLDIF